MSRFAGPHADGLMTLAEAADHLGVSQRTLQRRIAAGAIAVFRDSGIVRVSVGELRRYVATRTSRTGTSAPPVRRSGPAPRRLWD